jgi:hypothetical protein
MTTTITITNLSDELDVEFDPPDTSPHILLAPSFLRPHGARQSAAACRAPTLFASYATVPIK